MIKRSLNLTGLTFGELEVLGPAGVRGSHTYWECRCSCGKSHTVRGSKLINQDTRSCGHLRADHTVRRNAWLRVPAARRKAISSEGGKQAGTIRNLRELARLRASTWITDDFTFAEPAENRDKSRT
jgi:hypothetical protein